MTDQMLVIGSNSLPDLAARIRAEHQATSDALKRGLSHALTAGELLIEAKSQLKHGQWLPWLTEHCAMSDRTARLYMRVARGRKVIEAENGNVADLSVRGAVAMLSLPPADPHVLALADGFAEMSTGELAIVALDAAKVESKKRKAVYGETRAMLDRIVDLAKTLPAAHSAAVAVGERLLEGFLEAVADCTGALTDDIEGRGSSDPRATIAIVKAKKLAAEMLREVEAAAEGRAA
jgi:hypothetical protein